ncbi:zf-HC2 domain-containing protein [Microbacterium capsulatum]|uniref:Zf-HC2 domain-containing protein n=1 Tax=Microbacterium capsulatum TaxID=3041921 RepID=A0ABU0XGC5_9MICO|nr:zf-HC2 domain-containing protein [Microbacterium sp. ASV81]MDQ4213952.1 zf-HC2 domain-containing protein [Microbacterium sp. ASV81]
MNAQHERFETWDAAYALGALPTSERAEYEAHLAHCAACRSAVAELGPAVALLSRLSAEDAERIDEPVDEAPSDAPIRLLQAARTRRRNRRRALWWGAGAAAAVAIAVPLSLALLAPRPAVSVELEGAAYVHATASVSFTPVPWGTRLDMECAYDSGSPVAKGAYALVLVAADGTTIPLSTWNVTPGATARLSAGTAERMSDIRTVEIRDPSGTVVLSRDLR